MPPIWIVMLASAIAAIISTVVAENSLRAFIASRLSIDDFDEREELVSACRKRSVAQMALQYTLETVWLIGVLFATWNLFSGSFPIWARVAVIWALSDGIVTYVMGRHALRHNLPNTLREAGRCERCGYDMQHRSGVCPECQQTTEFTTQAADA